MRRVLFVFGTRPEAIKLAPIIREFNNYRELFHVEICVTGQHREMLDQVLDVFKITPDYDLNIMRKSQYLSDLTARILFRLRKILQQSEPDIVLVHGDTTSAVSAALTAYYQGIPIGHIEAGLRTHNIFSPWPEEGNRQIISRLATYHFTPSTFSRDNLFKEGINKDQVFVTGSTAVDAILWALDDVYSNPEIEERILKRFEKEKIDRELVRKWKLKIRKMVLITCHRRENFGKGFNDIFLAIRRLSETNPDVDFVYPMHLNPNVRDAINKVFSSTKNVHIGMDNVHFIEPLDYYSFVHLMNLSCIILTDSGSIQEEAPTLGKPLLVLRNETERPEGLDEDGMIIVGTDKQHIINQVTLLLKKQKDTPVIEIKQRNPYGEGNSSKIIVNHIKTLLYKFTH